MYFTIDKSKETKFTTDVKNLEELLKEFETGELLIPSFQRNYQWKKENVLKFIATIMSKRPIGQLIAWSTKDCLKLANSALNIDEENLSNRTSYTYLIDGQQRITTLYHLYHGTEGGVDTTINFKEFYITLNPQKFIVFDSSTRPHIKEKYISIHELINLRARKKVANLTFDDDLAIQELRDRFISGSKVEYRIQNDINVPSSVAAEYFVQLNTSSAPLNEFDIFSAQMYRYKQKSFDELVRNIQDYLGSKELVALRKTKFDDCSTQMRGIIENTLSAEYVLNRLLNGKKSGLFNKRTYMNFTNEEFWKISEEYYKTVTEGVTTIMKNVFNIHRYGAVPTSALYTVSYAFAKLFKKPTTEDYQFFKGLATLYMASKKFHEKVNDSVKLFIEELFVYRESKNKNDEIAKTVKLEQKKRLTQLKATITPYTLISDDRGVMKKVVRLIMSYKKPTQLLTGNHVDFTTSHQYFRNNMHHLKPKATFKISDGFLYSEDNVFNLCFLDAKTNQQVIKDKEPKDYIPTLEQNNEHFGSFKETQFLSEKTLTYLKNGDYDNFIISRAEELVDYLSEVIILNPYSLEL